MDFHYADYFGSEPSTGYERLLYDGMIGDATLFQRADMVEAGWAVVEPVLDVWRALPPRAFPELRSRHLGAKRSFRSDETRRPTLAHGVDRCICYDRSVMAIPNVKRFRPFCPTCNESYTLMAVLPNDANVDAFLADAVARHDHKAFNDAKAQQNKVRVGQQKQKKAK